MSKQKDQAISRLGKKKDRRRGINIAKASRIVGYGSLGMLGIIGLALLLPKVSHTSQAESCLDNPTLEGCYTTMTETEVGVTANTAISLAMDQKVDLTVVPTSTGATSSASTKLAVSTNSSDGYALYMQAGSSTGNLASTSSTIASEIKNTARSNVTLSDLEKNSYGYALTQDAVSPSTAYSTIPTIGSVIKRTTSVTPTDGNFLYGDTYYLSFGVNIGTDIEAGTYSGSVMLSAVANPKTLATMFDLTYMQDMTTDICTNTREHYTKQLIDSRDGKSYWVAKLKDGNCWMTQNLAYTITQEMIDNNEINSTNTDLHPNNPSLTGAGQLYTDETTGITYWNNNEAVTYKPSPTNSSALSGTAVNYANATHSWDFGIGLQATPEIKTACHREDGSAVSMISGDTPGKACENVGFVDVDETWRPTFVAQEGSWKFADGTEYSGLVAVDEKAKTYDSHYLLGNYYQGNAAAAGTAGVTEESVAPSSVCPKGWRLPTDSSVNHGVDTNGTYAYLLKYYYPGIETDMGNLNIFYDKDGEFEMVQLPLAFALSGIAYQHAGGVINLGRSGNLRTSYMLTENGTAMRSPWLDYGFSSDNPYGYIWFTRRDDDRNSGASIRCLAW